MNAQAMTLEEVRVRGIHALKNELGSVGMLRFMQQFETGHGDYTQDRHEVLDNMNVDAIVEEIYVRRQK